MLKWHKDWKRILRTYSFISIVANLLVAISVTGLSVLGVLSSNLAFGTIACIGIVLGVLGCAGRFVDQELDDLDRGSSK